MKLVRTYTRTLFPADVLQRAVASFVEVAKPREDETPTFSMSLEDGPDSWDFDEEAEFWDAYRRGFSTVRFAVHIARPTEDFRTDECTVFCYQPHGPNPLGYTSVAVRMSSRAHVLRVMEVVDSVHGRFVKPPPEAEEVSPPPPTIFVGHGRDRQWDDLKDHLHEKHGYAVEAYETGERAGHAIRDILDSMAETSSFALLVMTAEDEQPDGVRRARQNVVHELGLFQGHLGWSRAIVLLEDGVEEFSNIQGIQQIRFGQGRIREVFGDVLAVLRREFHVEAVTKERRTA